MYKPRGLTKIYVQEKTPLQRKLPKSVVALFTIAQLSFGFDFGFVKTASKIPKKAVMFATVFVACFMVLILIQVNRFENVLVFFTIYFIQYVPTFFVLISTKYSLCEFLTDLLATEEQSVDSKVNKVGIIAWSYTASVFIFKFVNCIIYSLQHSIVPKQYLVINVLMHIPMLGLDMIPVANFILFYYIYVQMRNLKEKIEQKETNAERFYINYEGIADKFAKFRRSYDAIFVCGFLIDSAKWILFIWSYLDLMKDAQSWLTIGCGCAWAIHITKQICVPAVFAEMINAQTDGMKVIIRQQCLVETDEAVSAAWEKVLRYMEARPLLRKAWRLVPVDLRQPVTMLSMSTAYLIVIIQFTHLYD